MKFSHIYNLKTYFIVTLFTVFQQTLQAQGQALDFLRSTGKIYSVVLVILIIFIGIIAYLYRLDNKLTKLENHIKNGH